MAFVYEKMKEEDWDWYNQRKAPITPAKSIEYWTVDKENDMYLLKYSEKGRLRLETYIFVWNGFRTFIDVEVIEKEDTTDWSIEYITSTKELKSDKEKLIQLIKEAVKTMYVGNVNIIKVPVPVFKGDNSYGYILRKTTEDDKKLFRDMKCDYGFGLYSPIVVNRKENIWFIPKGGQGYMDKNGKMISDVPKYYGLIWGDKSFDIQVYHYEEIFAQDSYKVLYMIKEITYCTKNKTMYPEETKRVCEIIKKCLIAYDNKGIERTVCLGVNFIENKVFWR